MSGRHTGQFDTGAGAPDIERLTEKLDTLLRLHEDEGTQVRTLRAKLDRVIEEFALSAPARAPQALADEVRRGVSEDLKPLLHAIIELLELAMSRMTPVSSESPGAEPPPDTEPGGTDDLPRALPQILTKSVEELVGKAGARKTASSRASRRSGGKEAAAAGGGGHLGAWIPVTSGTFDS